MQYMLTVQLKAQNAKFLSGSHLGFHSSIENEHFESILLNKLKLYFKLLVPRGTSSTSTLLKKKTTAYFHASVIMVHYLPDTHFPNGRHFTSLLILQRVRVNVNTCAYNLHLCNTLRSTPPNIKLVATTLTDINLSPAHYY